MTLSPGTRKGENLEMRLFTNSFSVIPRTLSLRARAMATTLP